YVGEDSGAFPLFTSIAFDLTVTSIFVPLITGNKVVIYPEQDDVATIVQRVISEDRVDVIKATPSHLRIIAESALDNPRFQEKILRFVVGGEEFDSQLAKSIYDSFNGHVKIFNEYGPTEATVGCMIYEFDPSATLTGTVPIGRPGQNTQIYLLDRYLKPVPVGVHGELFIAGYCLSNGYLFNEALTNERFIDNPYDPGTKMYTTGDIGKRLKDGNIDFVGRADSQIKINGYRIEPREIECELLDYDLLDEVVVCLSQSRIS